MSKLRAMLVGACALAAFFAVTGTASAITDPDCDGVPYDNTPLIHDFRIDTPDSHVAKAVSGTTGGGLVCGSDLRPLGGDDTLYDHATVKYARGVGATPTSGHEGEYVGEATVTILFRLFGPRIAEHVESNLRVNPISECEGEQGKLVGDPTPGTVIACYYGWNWVGWNWNWITDDDPGPAQDLYLTIGPMYGFGDVTSPGMTEIEDMSLCAYFGPGGGPCGTSGTPVGSNGDQSAFPTPACSNGNGVYTATATRRDGLVTPPASTCVKWFPVARRQL